MNVAAIRWFRWVAKIGLVLFTTHWLINAALNGYQNFGTINNPGVSVGERVRLAMSSVFDPLYMWLHGLVAAAVLFVVCEIALHLHRTHHPGPDE